MQRELQRLSKRRRIQRRKEYLRNARLREFWTAIGSRRGRVRTSYAGEI